MSCIIRGIGLVIVSAFSDAVRNWLIDVLNVEPSSVILFGSYARGTSRPKSDIDFYVVTENIDVAQAVRRLKPWFKAEGKARFGVAVDVSLWDDVHQFAR